MLTDNPLIPLILIVEDDENHAELIQRAFKNASTDFRLKFASTMLDAHTALDQQFPNLIVTDYRLPDGDGSELIIMVDGACPVVLMTSQGNEQVAVEAMKSGAQDYIVKSPDAFGHLPETVKYAMQTWTLVQSRKLADEAVRRGKREWEQTFDAVPDLIAIIDSNHTIVRVNRAMSDSCQLTPDKLVGRKCYDLPHCANMPKTFCLLDRMLQDGQSHSEETEVKEMERIFDITVSPLYDSEGLLTAGVHVARDITERKKAEEKRQELERQFQHAQKLESIGVLAGGIAHDFNNILTIILGHCFIVKEDLSAGMTEKSHILQIESAAIRAADLCRQMLTYAGKNPLVQTHVNMWLLLEEIVKMLSSAIKKNVVFELDLQRDIPEIKGDNSQIQQIVMNLIINAAEAIGDAHGTIRIALNNEAVLPDDSETDFFGSNIPAGRYVCLEVADTGCGMDEMTQKRVFEPFYTTKFAGRGLGMSAILGIIKSHDGALKLSSSPGIGTTFKVYFPLPHAVVPAEKVPPIQPYTATNAGGTILLVDDEEGLRIIGTALLTAMGFSVVVAANGREALKIFCSPDNTFCLVMLDLMMPVMGGYETYCELRKLSLSVPLVICSGFGDGKLREELNMDAHAEFVQKPYNPDEILEVFNKIIRK